MRSEESLKEIKINSLKRLYSKFKQAEDAGTLKKVLLSEEQRLILQPASA